MTYKSEKEKYIDIYNPKSVFGSAYQTQNHKEYGSGLWGGNIIDYIKNLNVKSILDVGCGQGKFCNEVSKFIPAVYGVDIASVCTNCTINNGNVNFLDGEAKSIPISDNSVECLTSFDVLEHCLPEDIDAIVKEFNRVATKYYIFSIAYTSYAHDGVPLHMTVQPQEWWMDKFKNLGSITFEGKVPYIPYDKPYMIITKK